MKKIYKRNKTLKLLAFLCAFSVPVATTQLATSAEIFWSTTYDCPEWEWSYSNLDPHCDGLFRNMDNAPSGKAEQITDAANMAAGEGGKGQRHWLCDGENKQSGGTFIKFNRSYPEMWVRWYMRWEKGFKWSSLHGQKLLYFNPGTSYWVVPHLYHYDSIRIYGHGSSMVRNYDFGWEDFMGGRISDGEWHLFEFHIKANSPGKRDGVGEIWVDEQKVISANNLDFRTSTGWSKIVIGSNQKYPGNGTCKPVDYDDIAVSLTGYIGPLGSGTPPTEPPTEPPSEPPSGTPPKEPDIKTIKIF